MGATIKPIEVRKTQCFWVVVELTLFYSAWKDLDVFPMELFWSQSKCTKETSPPSTGSNGNNSIRLLDKQGTKFASGTRAALLHLRVSPHHHFSTSKREIKLLPGRRRTLPPLAVDGIEESRVPKSQGVPENAGEVRQKGLSTPKRILA